eukprot:1180845-Prorocentrum_minimum.AAC.2
MLDSEEAWGASNNQDVFFNHVLPAIATQPEVQHLDKQFAPPTPGGMTPFSAARTRQALAVAPTPAAVRGEVEVQLQTPGAAGLGPEQEMPVPLGTGQGGRLPVAEDQTAALMSTAREAPATADLRQAMEQLQLQLQQLRDGGDPTGAELGFKSGEIGAPNNRLVVENVLYLEVGAITKPQKREIVTLINTESVTDKQGCGEEAKQGGARAAGGPAFDLAKLLTRWLSIRSCKLDVYAPDHPESFFYIQSANLILARLEFLKEMLYHLTNSGYSWPGVWRYLLLVWEGHMRPFGWLHKIRFDQTLIDAYHSPVVPQLAMAQLASTSVLAPELLRSEAAAAATLQVERSIQSEVAPGVSGKAQRVGPRPGEKCSLCSSPEHTYRSPDYVCTGPITPASPALLTDGKVCGERHAHPGPLKSPCRGGLEQSGRQRPRGGIAGGSGAGPSGVARAP